jgi:hypothetical protein
VPKIIRINFPTCYVEEVPYAENIQSALEPQARENTRGRLCEEFPTCYVEEVPYMDVVSQGTCAVMVHHTDIAAMDTGEGNANAEAVIPGKADTKEMKVTPDKDDETPTPTPNRTVHVHSGAQPPFLHVTHLDLVFELRGQMADQEHRALLMGQRLDMLLDAYSNAPANRKCPTCAQPFVIQDKATWQEDKEDKPPGI